MSRVALFVTCLVDFLRPEVGFAAVDLLESAGFDVVVPEGQTCCGQPAFNNGDYDSARRIATQVMDAFGSCELIVVPSGSCGGMLRLHYPSLFHDDTVLAGRAEAFSRRCFELTDFLVSRAGVASVPGNFQGPVAIQDSCSALRELGVCSQPRALLAMMPGVEQVGLPDPETCCGFGGTFCVKYPELSSHIVSRKARGVVDSACRALVSVDLGCLIHIAGRLSRMGERVQVRHIAELLAGRTDAPAIGEDRF